MPRRPEGLSYPAAEQGATRDPDQLPSGYSHLRYRAPIGTGPVCFLAAADAVLGWRMHRAIGVRIDPGMPRAAPGVPVVVRLGPLRAPCTVVWSEEPPPAPVLPPAASAPALRAGFAYGTRPGHPERGEEAFVVELDGTGTVWLSVTAFSRPATWFTRTLGPLVPVFQRAYVARCAHVLRRAAG